MSLSSVKNWLKKQSQASSKRGQKILLIWMSSGIKTDVIMWEMYSIS